MSASWVEKQNYTGSSLKNDLNLSTWYYAFKEHLRFLKPDFLSILGSFFFY